MLRRVSITSRLLISGACFFVSCKEKVGTPAPSPQPTGSVSVEPSPEPETYPLSVCGIRPSSGFSGEYGIHKLTVLVYSERGGLILDCLEEGLGDTVDCEVKDNCDKEVFVFANLPWRLNPDAFYHSDALSLLEISLDEDSPQYPVMYGSSVVKFTEGAFSKTEVRLSCLMAQVEILSISNLLQGGDSLLEDPRVWIENISTRAQIIRPAMFPLMEDRSSRVIRLNDVGMYTQYPRARFHIYPNDGKLKESVLKMEYFVNGEKHTLSLPLGEISRGEYIPVDISVGPYL